MRRCVLLRVDQTARGGSGLVDVIGCRPTRGERSLDCPSR